MMAAKSNAANLDFIYNFLLSFKFLSDYFCSSTGGTIAAYRCSSSGVLV